MNKAYAKGRRLEYRALKALEAEGYIAARTAGSHGVFDIVALKGVEPALLIQVKCNISEAAAMRELKKIRKLFHEFVPANFEVWVYYDGVKNAVVYP